MSERRNRGNGGKEEEQAFDGSKTQRIPLIRPRPESRPPQREEEPLEDGEGGIVLDDTLDETLDGSSDDTADMTPPELKRLRALVTYVPGTKGWKGELSQVLTDDMRKILLGEYKHLLRPEEIELLEKF